MSNVIVDKQKIDILANVISDKSGVPVTMTLAEMVDAVEGIQTGGGITPTGNIDISSAGVTDVTNYATATVPSATISAQTITPVGEDFEIGISSSGLITADILKNTTLSPITANGFVETTDTVAVSIIGQATSQLSTQAAKTVTPTESQQTAVAAHRYTTGAVTVSAIPSNYVGSGVTQRTSSDLTASGATVTAPAGYYAEQATKTVASGTAGTPTATKSAVNNHAVTVTPSVTNTTGYITGSTKTGTAVSVSASELVSGNLAITQSGTTDVTNYETVSVTFQTIYSGSTNPSSGTGVNGDVYIKVVS